MKKLLVLCVLAVSSLNLHAQDNTCGKFRAEVSDYLQAHLLQVSRSGPRVGLVGDGEIFAVQQKEQVLRGFSERIVLERAGDSFIANFNAEEGVNTVLSLVKMDAAGINLRYRVMDARSGTLRVDEGTIYLPIAKTGGRS